MFEKGNQIGKTMSMRQEHFLKLLLDNTFVLDRDIVKVFSGGHYKLLSYFVKRMVVRGYNIERRKVKTNADSRGFFYIYWLSGAKPILNYSENREPKLNWQRKSEKGQEAKWEKN